jgi:hypothetical protein
MTDPEIVERLYAVLPSRATAKAALPAVKAMLLEARLEARIDALEIILAAADSDLVTTVELELNHYRRELAALKEKG